MSFLVHEIDLRVTELLRTLRHLHTRTTVALDLCAIPGVDSGMKTGVETVVYVCGNLVSVRPKQLRNGLVEF